MQFTPIKTQKLIPPKDDLYQVLDESLPKLKEGDVVLVTSKVVAIHQGRCVPIKDVPDKDLSKDFWVEPKDDMYKELLAVFK